MCRRENIRIRCIRSINRITRRLKGLTRNPKRRRIVRKKISRKPQGYLMRMVICDF
jgi:hypothetical protein